VFSQLSKTHTYTPASLVALTQMPCTHLSLLSSSFALHIESVNF